MSIFPVPPCADDSPHEIPGNICYRNPQISQIEALQAVAAVAPGLSEAELRVLLALAVRAVNDPDFCCSASSRELAASTRCARANVQRAVDSLTAKLLIVTRLGGSKSASVYMLSFLKTFAFAGSLGGLAARPPTPNYAEGGWHRSEATSTTSAIGQAVDSLQSPEMAQNVLFRSIDPNDRKEKIDRLRAGAINANPIEAMAKAKPKHYTAGQIDLARRWMYGLAVKLGREKDRHPPDDELLAQFLAIAPWPRLLSLLIDLQSEGREVGYSYGWFLTVALQRIHNMSWSPAKQRAALAAVPATPVAAPEQVAMEFPAPGGDGGEFLAESLRQVGRKAVG